MNRPVNPYIAGAPLRGERGFFGRQDTLDWVVRELCNPSTNALVLFGQRRIGKTTLLLQLQRRLSTEMFLPVYFDLQDQATRPLGQVLADLADTIIERAGLQPLKSDLFDNQGYFFRRTVLKGLYQVLGERRPVFLLDEFDVLDLGTEMTLSETAAAKTLFSFLRTLMIEDPYPAFVFVVGRRAEDLSLNFMSTFKASLVHEIWILDRESAEKLVRQAEANRSLHFTDNAVERILTLTDNHPYLTQLLCQRVWEQAYQGNPSKPPSIDIPEVEAAIPDVLEAGSHALVWLWNGMAPAEKIYTAALAEAAEERAIISENSVIQVLTAHAARLRTREVELAPRDLVKRRVLEEIGKQQYHFAVELFRRWVRLNKPVSDVKVELDRVDPVADRLHDIGLSFFNRRQWEDASRYFRDTLVQNPQHFRARLHLAEALLELGQTDEALTEMQQAYELDHEEARLPLARTLIIKAKLLEKARDDDGALTIADRVLQISPNEQSAQEIKVAIWTRRGDSAFEHKDLEAALAAYVEAGQAEKVAEIEEKLRTQKVIDLQRQVETLEKSKEYKKAMSCIEQLISDFPGEGDWERDKIRLMKKLELAENYRIAIQASDKRNPDYAKELFTQIVALEPDYEDALEQLLKIVKGIDVAELRNQLVSLKNTKEKAELEARNVSEAMYKNNHEIQLLREQLSKESKPRENAEKELQIAKSKISDLEQQVKQKDNDIVKLERHLREIDPRWVLNRRRRNQTLLFGSLVLLSIIGSAFFIFYTYPRLYEFIPNPDELQQAFSSPQNGISTSTFRGYTASSVLIEWTRDTNVETCDGSTTGISVDFLTGDAPLVAYNNQYNCSNSSCRFKHPLGSQPIYKVTVAFKCGRDAIITLIKPSND